MECLHCEIVELMRDAHDEGLDSNAIGSALAEVVAQFILDHESAGDLEAAKRFHEAIDDQRKALAEKRAAAGVNAGSMRQ